MQIHPELVALHSLTLYATYLDVPQHEMFIGTNKSSVQPASGNSLKAIHSNLWPLPAFRKFVILY